MRLVIVRHAIAADRTPEMRDEDRALTAEGVKKFRRAARGLAAFMKPPDLLLTSPLVRARQTAEILAQAWGGPALEEEATLAGGTVDDVGTRLDTCPPEATVAVVGHEPQLSALLAQLLGTNRSERLEFRKGGVAVVDLAGAFAEGGRLVSCLPPKVLRALSGD